MSVPGKQHSEMLISIVVPAYNEQENVQPFYHAILEVMNDTAYQWEIIYVNDGSHDGTVSVLQRLHEQDDRVKYISLSRNFGSYSAISAGLRYAKGDGVVVISCDLQDPPELIAEFLTRWERGADIVWGVRASRVDPGLKSTYANTFYWLLRRFVWPDFPPGGMDYGLFDRRIIDLYNSLPIRNTIPFLAIYDLGFRQEQIPYHRRERKRGTSKWTFFRRIKAAIDVILDFSYFPIRLVSSFGIVIALLSILYAFVVAMNRVLFGVGGAGWPSTIVVITFLGGIQLIVLGMLGEYIWRVVEQVRERPRFIVMDQVGFETAGASLIAQEAYHPHSHAEKDLRHA